MDARMLFAKANCLDVMLPLKFKSRLFHVCTPLAPFVKIFQGQAVDQHAKTYICGLLSDDERKNVESIAYRLASPSALARLHWLG